MVSKILSAFVCLVLVAIHIDATVDTPLTEEEQKLLPEYYRLSYGTLNAAFKHMMNENALERLKSFFLPRQGRAMSFMLPRQGRAYAFPRLGRAYAFPRLGRGGEAESSEELQCCKIGLKSEWRLGEEQTMVDECPDVDCCEGLGEIVHQRKDRSYYSMCLPQTESFMSKLRNNLKP